MQFRKDINGLRAIAVIAVILFHLNNNYLPGGFAGVDVFFIISGFLMTKIIVERLNNNKFSIWDFYCARAKRIVPALSCVCLSLMLLGYLFLYPSDYAQVGEDSFSSLLFYSNFLYLSRAGYFDDSSVNNLLLHTWSLSVEWQFYIIYPVIIYAIARSTGIKSVKKAVIVMTVLSFAASLYGTYNYAEQTYFMFPTRAWAMLSGGCVYFFSAGSMVRKTASPVGLILVLTSFFVIDKNTPWPSEMALLPVLGASLIILAGTSDFITNNRVAQFIGTISYEMYLVHWPVIIFYKKLNIDIGPVKAVIIVLVLSAALHYLCDKTKKLNFTNGIVYFIACILSSYVVYAGGFSDRVPEQFRISKKEFHKKYYGGSSFPANQAFFENASKGTYKYIFAGDSFALQYATDVKNSGLPSAEIYSHGCLMLPDYSRFLRNKEFKECSDSYRILAQLMEQNKTAPLIFTLSWDTYIGAVIKKGASDKENFSDEEYLDMIKSQVRKIIETGGPEREYYFTGRAMPASIDGFGCLSASPLPGYRLFSACSSEQTESRPEINQAIKDAVSGYRNAHFIDPNDSLCSDGKCLIIKDSEPVYSDQSHLSIYGSRIVFADILKKLSR
ncbi:acyltransferase family protein [Escherichia coli O121:H11]